MEALRKVYGGGVHIIFQAPGRSHGLSMLVTGGVARLIACEYFVEALRAVYAGPIVVIALVDWDPGGYLVATSFVQHMLRYGYACPGFPRFVLRPEVFTEEELELFAKDLKGNSAADKARIRNWVERTGGIQGRPRGITLNCLHPLERLEPVLEGLLA